MLDKEASTKGQKVLTMRERQDASSQIEGFRSGFLGEAKGCRWSKSANRLHQSFARLSLRLALHRDTVVSGPPNVPSASVPFLRMIIVIRNGQILSRDMTLLRAGVERKVMLRCTILLRGLISEVNDPPKSAIFMTQLRLKARSGFPPRSFASGF